jgi:hypothetical protein
MTDQPKDRKGLLKLVAYPFSLLVLYVLSIGPAAKMERANILPTRLMSVYKPLGFIARHSKTADKFFDWYIFELWGCRRMD